MWARHENCFLNVKWKERHLLSHWISGCANPHTTKPWPQQTVNVVSLLAAEVGEKQNDELGLETRREKNPIPREFKPKCLPQTGRIAQQAPFTQYGPKGFWLILSFIQSIIDLQNNQALFVSLGKVLICKVLFGNRKPEFFFLFSFFHPSFFLSFCFVLRRLF